MASYAPWLPYIRRSCIRRAAAEVEVAVEVEAWLLIIYEVVAGR
jgi:hypothetical protein